MELKYTNSNGEIILASELYTTDLFFWGGGNKKIQYVESAHGACKTRWSIIFTSLIQIEFIKAFHIDKACSERNKKLKNFVSIFVS